MRLSLPLTSCLYSSCFLHRRSSLFPTIIFSFTFEPGEEYKFSVQHLESDFMLLEYSSLLRLSLILLKQNQVLLVDQSERFVFKPMLYELLSGGLSFCVVIEFTAF